MAGHRRPRAALPASSALTLLTGWLALTLLLPSRLVVPALGSLGYPAAAFGLFLLVVWLTARCAPSLGPRTATPLHWALAVLVLAIPVGAAAAYSRPLRSVEANGVILTSLRLLSLVGVALTAADALPDRRTVQALVRRVVVLASLVSVSGLVEFVTRRHVLDYLSGLPGLAPRGIFGISTAREGFERAYGTTLHPLEFAVVLALALPLALHLATAAGTRRRPEAWLCVGLIAAGLPLSVSRTSVIAVGISLVVLGASWGWRRRLSVATAAVVLLAAMAAAIPGLLSTITGLFGAIGEDDSTVHRADALGAALTEIAQRPVFGQGIGTYIPSEAPSQSVPVLDNQFLLTTVTQGAVGLLALVGVIATGWQLARRTRSRLPPGDHRDLATALSAAVAVTATSFVTLDALSFPSAAGLVFLLLGLVAAHWRLSAPPR